MAWLPTEASVEAEAGASRSTRASRLSPQLRDIIRAGLPRYIEKPETPAEAAVGEIGLMDRDVLVLPTLVVQRLNGISSLSTDWMTAAGRVDHAMKRNPGAKIGNIFGTNRSFALALLTEELEAGRKQALKDHGSSVLLDESEHTRETRALLKEALMPRDREWMKGGGR